LRNKTLLVPNHVGSRIHDDLKGQGFKVEVLVDREWRSLSPRIRVMCLPDWNQDAVLLVDVGGTLVVNLNDAGDRGWGHIVKKVVKQYRNTFLIALSGYGDADMINYFNEDGTRILPHSARKTPVGANIARMCEVYGVKYFIPFSSMHKYQRQDTLWASEYTTTLADYPRGFDSKTSELLPAFIRYHVDRAQVEEIKPRERAITPVDPKEFGDDWSERLEKSDVEQLARYFKSVQHLERTLDFLRFRVGGEDHVITFNNRKFNRGITFEAPRNSLMTSVKYEIFDDLLIGNFMKTTLHGDFGQGKLYPDFTPYVAKYADNGRARTANEVKQYFAQYRERDPLGFMRSHVHSEFVIPLQERTASALRTMVRPDSRIYRAAKEAFWSVRRRM
jgi:hypothetical protein